MFMLPKRARTLARNSHLKSQVDATLAAVSPIVQQHNTNAIQAAGFPVLVYQRFTSGIPCSCSKLRPTTGSLDLYDENGDASDAVIESIRHQAQFGLSQYNPEGRETPVALEEVEEGTSLKDNSVVGGEAPTSEAPMEAFTAGSCGVCFGTGFIGGYFPLGSVRSVFTYRDITSSHGCEVDRTVFPHALVLSGTDSWVEFILPTKGLPKYNSLNPSVLETSPSIVNVWNNTVPLEVQGNTPNLTVTSRLSGKFPYQLADSNCKLPNEGSIVRVSYSDLSALAVDEQVTFTHVEVMSNQTKQPFTVDIPNLSRAYDPTRATPFSSTTMEIPANVPPLSAWDVIADAVNQQLWLVSSSKATSPSSQQIWFQTAEVTPIEPHWLQARLPLPSPGWLNSNKRSLTPVSGSQLSFSRRGGF